MIAEISELRFLLNGEGCIAVQLKLALIGQSSRNSKFSSRYRLAFNAGCLLRANHDRCRAMDEKIAEANRDLYEEAKPKRCHFGTRHLAKPMCLIVDSAFAACVLRP